MTTNETQYVTCMKRIPIMNYFLSSLSMTACGGLFCLSLSIPSVASEGSVPASEENVLENLVHDYLYTHRQPKSSQQSNQKKAHIQFL